ncbi:DNA repair protein complementing XP-A cells homolog isoform X2 [Agrilus planipennis]|uniref:DNA repair protein complementing XP-A cells homolog isoform X2 n=1 Tax=Agrilus planipennis TaxID=224129 RepID=A0A1W4XFV5_AGRPL|nr:DNA repair protein complementing XP-A cells homolog isoform X2 [Agrilus planipennis]
MNENNSNELTKTQIERIEKNKQRAFTLRKTQMVIHPYSKRDIITKVDKGTLKIGNTRYKDTGGGFLLEQDNKSSELTTYTHVPPVFECDRPICKECKKVFANSWLFDSFDYSVCDSCKDPEIHKLITKTDALNKYLLKECDINKREPILKFIEKKNPHNSQWVEQRALEIWGSEEKLQEELNGREEKKVEAKIKKYQKEMKKLRMNMRSSLYDKTSAISHTHEFGSESYNEEDDTYTHKCLTCFYTETFEKM